MVKQHSHKVPVVSSILTVSTNQILEIISAICSPLTFIGETYLTVNQEEAESFSAR